MRINRITGFIVVLSLFCTVFTWAKEFKAAVKQLPTTDTYIAILKAIVEATGNTVDVQVVPPARADYLIENKQVDIQYPMAALSDNPKFKALKFDFSTAVLYKLAFVIYTNKDKPVDIESIKKGNTKKYKIEIDPSRAFEYDFTGMASSNFEASFTKLSEGKIDCLILAQTSGDALLKKLALKNIKRQLWQEYDLLFTIAKGSKGGEVDKMLSDGVAKLKAAGKFDQVVSTLAKTAKYDNWQP